LIERGAIEAFRIEQITGIDGPGFAVAKVEHGSLETLARMARYSQPPSSLSRPMRSSWWSRCITTITAPSAGLSKRVISEPLNQSYTELRTASEAASTALNGSSTMMMCAPLPVAGLPFLDQSHFRK
jgi:hypothetical protein